MRNFIPDSADFFSLINAASAAVGRAVNSKAMYIVINSIADASSIIPVADKRMSE